VFAATLLLIAGTLNIIYGIGALDDANIFVNDKRYIFINLNTLGWVLIVLRVIQLSGGLSVGGAYAWWSRDQPPHLYMIAQGARMAERRGAETRANRGTRIAGSLET